MKGKILVIDDEPQFERLILQRFRRKVREGVYEFLFAKDGVEALELIKQEPEIDMALTDINMPRMDGLTFLSKLREIKPKLKAVVVSAYGDMKNIRTAMNLGAFDFVTKPIEFQDLEKTIEKTLQEWAVIKKTEELEEKNVHLQELDHFKTQFFTNISHEFRTPLTIIKGMADQIEENPSRWTEKGVHMIRRNAHNLLDLVNQILELRKLESGRWELRNVRADLVPYTHYLFDTFHALAETKDIQLHFDASEEEIEMDFDPEKMLRIISNLLDNAIKFTPPGGHIYFALERMQDRLTLLVRDTGIGIPKEQLPLIFDRFFFQPGDTTEVRGAGIGLSLVKELVLLMNGTIEAESEAGSGTTFTIKLPITQEAAILEKEIAPESNIPLIPSATESPTASYEIISTDLPHLLIVEDNEDVSRYLSYCLEGRYQLSFASDGIKGVEKALENIPDIIISDVMMPGKNGYELCHVLKEDTRTSHIPIILLTAKADTDSRIEGLRQGADAYLSKPFEKKELILRLEKLLELREKLQARYSDSSFPDQKLEDAPKEDAFIVELRTAVEQNMEDENFGIQELCKTMIMSRTQLHRKIKALTGRSTSSFIRSLRLSKARKLLTDTDWNISQIAYEVGFKDPKYFSRTFTEEYGLSPRQARQ